MIYNLRFFSFQNAVCFIILTYLVPVLFIFYIQDVLKFKKINPLTPNDHFSGRTAPLTSKRCIVYIYSTNIGTEYFKHGIYSPFFSFSKCSLFHNSNVFGSCIIHILYTECAKNLKKKSGAKRFLLPSVPYRAPNREHTTVLPTLLRNLLSMLCSHNPERDVTLQARRLSA